MNEIVSTPNVPSDFLMRIASDAAIDADKLRIMAEIYINMQEKQRAWAEADDNRRAHREYLAAKSLVQKALPIVGRDANNPQTRSKYTRFESIWEQCCPVWTEHGFSVSFDVATLDNGHIRVKLLLEHRGGHTEEFLAPDTPSDTMGPQGKATKTEVQGNQSTVTYVQRGLLCRALGIAMKGFDEDGNHHTREYHEQAAPQASTDPLNEPNGTKWLKALHGMLAAATTMNEVLTISSHVSVQNALKVAPTLIRSQIKDAMADAYARFAAPEAEAADEAQHEAHEASQWAAKQEPVA